MAEPKAQIFAHRQALPGAKRLSATAGLMNGSAHFALSLSSRGRFSSLQNLVPQVIISCCYLSQWVIGWAAYVHGILPFVITARMQRG